MSLLLARLTAAFLPLLTFQPAHKAGDCMMLDAGGFTVDAASYKTSITLTKPEDVARLEALSRQQLGKQVAISLDGKVVATPTVRTVLTGPAMELTFGDTQGFDACKR